MNRQRTTELLPQKTKTLNSYKVRCVQLCVFHAASTLPGKEMSSQPCGFFMLKLFSSIKLSNFNKKNFIVRALYNYI